MTFAQKKAIDQDLARTWGIAPQMERAFDLRESMLCSSCQNSYRTRQLAKALVKVLGQGRLTH